MSVDRLPGSSIRRQLVVGVTLVHAVLMSVFIGHLVLRQKALLEDETRQRVRYQALHVADRLSTAFGPDDRVRLDSSLADAASDPAIAQITVLDARGAVIARHAGRRDGVSPIGTASDDVDAGVMRHGRRVATVRIRPRQLVSGDVLRDVLGEGVLYALGAMVLGMLFALLLAHRVTLRLYRLLEVADATRAGRRDLRAQPSRVHEVGRLAESFNAMLDALAEREQALARSNSELEARVDDRTADLAENVANHRAILEQANDAFITIDEDGRVVEWNRMARTIFGWTRTQAIGRTLAELIVPEASREAHEAGMARYLATGESAIVGRRIEVTACTRDGRELPVEISMRSRFRGQQRFFDAFLRDITERKQLEVSLALQALHDSLTGLPNRRLLLESLPRAMQRADRNGVALAVYFIDLDGFKAVNDSLGHEAGDIVLREFACRIRDSVRAVDMVARLAGDEFVVVAEAFHSPGTDAALVATKLLRVADAPYDIDGISRRLSSSVGVAVYVPGSGVAAPALLARADQAMYASKRGGKGIATVWSTALVLTPDEAAALAG